MGLTYGQTWSYNNNSPASIVYYLSSYLGYHEPDATLRSAPAFICPGYQRYNNNNNSMTNMTMYQRTYEPVNGLTTVPGSLSSSQYIMIFGYPATGSAPAVPSKKLSAVSSIKPLTDIWVLVDCDQIANPATSPEGMTLPSKPVHGNVRNYVYFDGHVATKKVAWDASNTSKYAWPMLSY